MKKYRFNFCDVSFIEFDEEKLNNFKDINLNFDDGTSKPAKLIYISREDKKEYYIMMPLDMLEEIEK